MHDTFFIVGAVRSGTTMLRLMLGRHTQICGCDELESVCYHLKGWSDWPPMAEVERALAVDRIWQHSNYQLPQGADFPTAMRDIPRQRREQDGKPVFGAVVHNDYSHLPRLWPDAKFIYLNRDPRDIARSCVNVEFKGDLYGASKIWLESRHELGLLKGNISDESYMELRFEDLAADPETWLTKICGFLGGSYEPGMLQIDENSTYQPPDPKLAKNWRTGASQRDIDLMERTMGHDAIRAAGYEPAGDGRPFSVVGHVMAGTRERMKRHQQGMRRFGTFTYWTTVIGRRLPGVTRTGVYKRAIARRNDIVQQGLK